MIDVTALDDADLDALGARVAAERSARDAVRAISEINVRSLTGRGVHRGDPWTAPTGGHDAYPVGWTVMHEGRMWVSLTPGNAWEPGVTGWREVTEGAPPAWVQPLGAHDAYAAGDVVTHGGRAWRSTIDANVWAPGAAAWWSEITDEPDGDGDGDDGEGEAPPAWVQPTGAHDAYPAGARVTHHGQTWTSSIDGNVWAPGTHGWAPDE